VARTTVARVALAATVLLGAAAGTGIVWAVQYPYQDLTQAYVEMLSVIAAIGALATFGLFWHYRR
jgi:hypothetical protein